ncbi:MAG: RtcB family protein [Clostridia bacterium]|nr:RtcB family protein [Clostridia bacterium]
MKDLKIFAKTIEPQAQAQIDLLLEQEAFKDCKVRIMPDVHAGIGCVIGFTANLGDKVIPNIVGVDIGCGMVTVSLGKIDIDYEKLDNVIRAYVPSGMEVRADYGHEPIIDSLRCRDQLRNVERLHASMGTLGGGNHFIEIDQDDEGNKYLIVHTGSRNLGKQVAEIYQDIAIKNLSVNKEERQELIARLKSEGREREIADELAKLKEKGTIPKELRYLEGFERDQYLYDMRKCQTFAGRNRRTIALTICQYMGFMPQELWHTVHNYIDPFGMVRKGAISAEAGKTVLIPMNMRDGCIIARGLGNEDWNCSAPHGAGRLMSRAKAKETIPLSEYRKTMDGVFTTSVSSATLDEAPMAYKPMDEILDCIAPTVQVLKIIKPVYNFKAGD